MKQKLDSCVAAIVRFYHIFTDVILGGVLLAVALYMFYFAGTIKIMKNPVSVMDTARFFPRLVFGALIPISLVILIKGFFAVKSKKETAPSGEALDAAVLGFERAVVTLVLIGLFVFLMEPIGFIPTAIAYMLASMFYMSVKENWKPVAYILTAVILALACYFLFRQFVYVRLPSGILKGVLG